MTPLLSTLHFSLLMVALATMAQAVDSAAPAPPIAVSYHIYAGSTHAHTSFTWSHGEQWAKSGDESGKKESGIFVDPDGSQFPAKTAVLKPNWQTLQGPPTAHFARAKEQGYDFYVTTDHSQEADLQPPSPTNVKWASTLSSAAEASSPEFVALTGFEYSENNSPNGAGHLNVINSAEYLNALAKGIDLPYLYRWLKTAKPNGDGPVVASFNHPSANQYGDWAFRDPEITEVITLLEVINSNDKIHYDAFVKALDKGWKVSPVCGNDNHGLSGISKQMSRTFVLATERTKPAILDAMKHRRTYAALDHNIQCTYTVNGSIMGSTLDQPDTLAFDISVSDPDNGDPRDRISRMDIVKDGGAIVETYAPAEPANPASWKSVIHDTSSKYFFVRVWSVGGGDAPHPQPDKPVAWLAPVWTGR